MAAASGHLHGLGELLSAYHFSIPDYQRGYSWGKPQREAFWHDLQVAVRSGLSQHFTGFVLLRQRASNSEPAHAEVVDGQQRIITAITLARALAQKACQFVPEALAKVNFKLTFEDNSELQSYFDFWALGDHREAARMSKECSSYAKNLKDAAVYFESCVQSLPDAQTAHDYLNTLLERFKLFVLDTHPGFDIHVAFETLNNRGKHLSKLELLKNRLLYLTPLLPSEPTAEALCDTELQRQIHATWKGIYRSLGRSEATQNHDDDFLRAHSIGYLRASQEANWLETALFTHTFSSSNAALSRRDVAHYLQSIETAAAWWAHIHKPSQLPPAHQKQLDRFQRISFAYFKPLMLAAYLRLGAETPRAVSHPSEHAVLLKPVLSLLREMERFIVMLFHLGGRQSHLGRADANALAHAVLQPLVSDFRPDLFDQRLSGADAVELAAAYLRASIQNFNESEERLDARFNWDGAFTAAGVEQTVSERMRGNGPGFYRWPFTRVLLLEYEEARRFAARGERMLSWEWDGFSFDETVEHIYPQKPDKRSTWAKAIPVDGRTRGLANAITQSLGNLMLLSKSVNSEAKNHPYVSVGDQVGKRDRYRGGSYSERQVVDLCDDWNIVTIAARGVAMLKFAEKRWDFELTSTPEDYRSYLPFLFGEFAQAVRVGEVGRKVDGRSLRDLVPKFLE